jgi:hypothetical protein
VNRGRLGRLGFGVIMRIRDGSTVVGLVREMNFVF